MYLDFTQFVARSAFIRHIQKRRFILLKEGNKSKTSKKPGGVFMFDYTVSSNHSTEETSERLKTALAEISFGVLWEFDLAKKFAEKELLF